MLYASEASRVVATGVPTDRAKEEMKIFPRDESTLCFVGRFWETSTD